MKRISGGVGVQKKCVKPAIETVGGTAQHDVLIAAHSEAGAQRSVRPPSESNELGDTSASLLIPNASSIFQALRAQASGAPSTALLSAEGAHATACATPESTEQVGGKLEGAGDTAGAAATMPPWSMAVNCLSQCSEVCSANGTCDVAVASICSAASEGSVGPLCARGPRSAAGKDIAGADDASALPAARVQRDANGHAQVLPYDTQFRRLPVVP